MKNTINWFEIPSDNFERAVNFYSSVFKVEFTKENMGNSQMAMWPQEDVYNSGAIIQHDNYSPNPNGVRIYLDGGFDLKSPLSRVKEAGGEVLVPKTKISDEHGFFALFQDTEGNIIGLHSLK